MRFFRRPPKTDRLVRACPAHLQLVRCLEDPQSVSAGVFCPVCKTVLDTWLVVHVPTNTVVDTGNIPTRRSASERCEAAAEAACA